MVYHPMALFRPVLHSVMACLIGLGFPAAIASAADKHDLPDAVAPVPVPEVVVAGVRQMSDRDVRVRIRGVSSTNGLGRVAFADWLRDHGASFGGEPADIAVLATAPVTLLLNLTSLAFQRADANHDGKVSPRELADLLLAAPPV
jgi:hypothetical protein